MLSGVEEAHADLKVTDHFRPDPFHSPYLNTKLFPPAAPRELVSRPRLLERLEAGKASGLTLISAPAGFGKTTLLNDWITHSGQSVAWVSLDRGDNDTEQFWHYIIMALQMLHADLHEQLSPFLLAIRSMSMNSIITSLINIISTFSRGIVLVLDNYQLITSEQIHHAITFLLEHLPQQLHLIIASRTDPHLPLACLRALGQLSEIRTNDLRFTYNETTAYLGYSKHLADSLKEFTALHTHIEGWIAGLRLFVLALHDQRDVSEFINNFTGDCRYIVDYVVDEVLLQQPDTIQSFLLQTSILDRLTSTLCNNVTDRDDGQALLEQLERTNLFIVPLDEKRHEYRYHQLFAEVLRNRLYTVQPESINALHRRATLWYGRNGFMTEAIHHAIIANDVEWIVHILGQSIFTMFLRGKVTVFLDWLKILPQKILHAEPHLCIYYAWALIFTHRRNAAEAYLQIAQSVANSRYSVTLAGNIDTARAYIARRKGDISQAIALSLQARESTPKENFLLQGLIESNLGIAYWMNGNSVEANHAFEKATLISHASNKTHLIIFIICHRARLYIEQGRLHLTAALFEQAFHLAGKEEQFRSVVVRAYLGLSHLSYERNNLAVAARHALDAIAQSELEGNIGVLIEGYLRLADVRQAQREWDTAFELVHKAKYLAQQHQLNQTPRWIEMFCTRLWIIAGDTEAAVHLMREHTKSRDKINDDLLCPPYLHMIEQIALARICIAQRKPDEALIALKAPLELARKAGLVGRTIELLIVQVVASSMLGRKHLMLDSLEQAVVLAETENYVRVFVDGGPLIAMALSQLLDVCLQPDHPCSVHQGYITTLLKACTSDRIQSVHGKTNNETIPLPEVQISARELEVLQGLTDGMSNQEIACKLVIAVGTVKRHTNNIYSKLNVQNRNQAIVKAKALKLLSPISFM